MPATLRIGSTGPDVVNLQLRLNLQGVAVPPLVPDGNFGPRTAATVIAFQRRERLVPDGIVGPLTQAALAPLPGNWTVVTHPVMPMAQPTPTSCWATSTAMVVRSTVAAVIARTPPDMIASNGGLLNSSGSDQAVVSGNRYGSYHGLRCRAPMSWTPMGMVNLLRRGPLIIDTLWDAGTYSAGAGSPGHMVVLAGVISDGDASGANTFVRVLDPWPPGRGKVSWQHYVSWVREVPARTYRIFER